MRLQNAENDQQRLDILAKLEPILNGHCSTPEKAISLPKKVITKGRPKGAVGSRLSSAFELAESNDKKNQQAADKDVVVIPPKRVCPTDNVVQQQQKRQKIDPVLKDKDCVTLDKFQFTVDENIPRENYITTMDVRGDGYCGFRVLALLIKGDENEFPSIKKEMLNELEANIEVYKRHFNYPVEELRKIVAYGHDLEHTAPGNPGSGCSYEYWFDASICAQLAADTFNTPIAIYSDAGKRTIITESGPEDVFAHPPVLYLPYRGPLTTTTPPTPLVMHFSQDGMASHML
ncbi:hypothetical protein DFQ28_004321 [Apophysomyces sp. BC1034]|nr:hypothetical protein DFQ28_004321 [Apophysomyces sp. BC1034]